ncbi:hypothetical protein MKW98_027105 [Papaver atlanticum]|uniref:40S ribosomal protein SA n=1 Tax=Papaver atlanticum TaxID=357466 RepID=A0AAD4X7J9_9MAGN|nr:hypothetical protein MKW98_027105 [Papaver atlanticum]
MFANIMRKYVKNPVRNFRLKFVLLIRLFFDNLDVNCGDFRGLVSGIEVYREFGKRSMVMLEIPRVLDEIWLNTISASCKAPSSPVPTISKYKVREWDESQVYPCMTEEEEKLITATMAKILSQKEEDIHMLLAADAHLGTKNVNFQMERYVFKKRADGIYIINLGKTWEKLFVAAKVIVAIENPQDIIVQSAC